MHWIIIVIVAIILISIIGWLKEVLWDSGIIKFLLRLAACAAAGFAVYYLYTLVGCPGWLIGTLAVFLSAYNILSWIIYINLKNKYVKVLEAASVQAKEIGYAAEEYEKMMKNKISDVINEAGMATDVEIFKMLEIGFDIDNLNRKRDELSKVIKIFDLSYGLVKEMRVVTQKKAAETIFKEQISVLLDEGEIKIQTKLNGDEKTAESWDDNLYCTTKQCMEGSNMLPPIHMEID